MLCWCVRCICYVTVVPLICSLRYVGPHVRAVYLLLILRAIYARYDPSCSDVHLRPHYYWVRTTLPTYTHTRRFAPLLPLRVPHVPVTIWCGYTRGRPISRFPRSRYACYRYYTAHIPLLFTPRHTCGSTRFVLYGAVLLFWIHTFTLLHSTHTFTTLLPLPRFRTHTIPTRSDRSLRVLPFYFRYRFCVGLLHHYVLRCRWIHSRFTLRLHTTLTTCSLHALPTHTFPHHARFILFDAYATPVHLRRCLHTRYTFHGGFHFTRSAITRCRLVGTLPCSLRFTLPISTFTTFCTSTRYRYYTLLPVTYLPCPTTTRSPHCDPAVVTCLLHYLPVLHTGYCHSLPVAVTV